MFRLTRNSGFQWIQACSIIAAGSFASHAVWSDCESQSQPKSTSSSLKDWLIEKGANVSKIAFEEVEDKGKGIIYKGNSGKDNRRRWLKALKSRIGWWGTTLATFPCDIFITGQTIYDSDNHFKELVKERVAGCMDNLPEICFLQLWLVCDANAKIKWLAVYKVLHYALQQDSPFEPYISSLPDCKDLPLLYSKEMLEQLSGTAAFDTLHVIKADAEKSFKQVEPLIRECCTRYGLKQVTLEHWLWALCIVLSRTVAIPRSANEADGAFRCLVPGLDYANHDKQTNCWWSVEWDSHGQAVAVDLKCPAHCHPSVDSEVCIQYQDTSCNESLLIRYGFVEEWNIYDSIKFNIPLNSLRSSAVGLKRLEALKVSGLLHPEADFVSFTLPATMSADEYLPLKAMNILHIINMSEKEVDGIICGDSKITVPEKLGDKLGVYTIFLGLLNQKLVALEGAAGARSLESDIKILEDGPLQVPQSLWHCVVYRANQKRIVRGYQSAVSRRVEAIIAGMNAREQICTEEHNF